jgi:hypothetical protein
MRETFASLGQLLGYYEYLKYNVTSIPALMPRQDFEKGHKNAAKLAQSSKEEKFALISDVENFPRYYFMNQRNYIKIPQPCFMEIFNCGYFRNLYPEILRYKSWGRLARFFDKEIMRNRNLPRKLKYASNLCAISKDMGKQCEVYFIEKGLIVPIEDIETVDT